MASIAYFQKNWFQEGYKLPGSYVGDNIYKGLPSWLNAVVLGLISSILPAVGIGSLVAVANYFPVDHPSLQFHELAPKALLALMSALGAKNGLIFFSTVVHSATSSVYEFPIYIIMPFMGYGFFTYTLIQREGRMKQVLNLEHQIKEAREILQQRKNSK